MDLRHRVERARAATDAAGLDALLITPGPDLRYLLGTPASSHERLTCLVLPARGTPTLVVPRLERPGIDEATLDRLGIEVIDWVDGSDPYRLVAAVVQRPQATTGVSDDMPARHVLGLRDAMPAAQQRLAGPVLRQLRMRKDDLEVAALRKAAAAIDRVHARMAELIKPGRTEAEVGADLAAAMVDEGHAAAAFVIVGSGPNGASPHHELSDRIIERGDVVVVDIGGPVPEGYHSDCTRTYVVGGEPPASILQTYAVLQEAQLAATVAVRPGVTAADVDFAARQALADAGLAEYFVHRTGHGIGLEVHEEPYIVAGNDLVLEPGMTFSVEPGVYFPRRWGARIEDIVLVTEDGCEPLNHRPRELVRL
jgi:Xaa-Pro aminopeptidase